MKRLMLVAVCVLTFLSVVAQPAFAGLGDNSGTGCGGFGSLGPLVGASVGCASSPTQTSPDQPKAPTSAGGSAHDTWKPADNDWGYVTCPNPTGPNMPDALQEYGPNGKPIGTPVVVCPGQPSPKPGVPAPPPPTPAQVWAQVPLPAPAFGINPSTVGVTQLASWFWATGTPGLITVPVTINGYSVTTRATAVAFQWNFGDGSTAVSTVAGSESNPSVTHTYHYKGTYIVSLSIEYAGTYSYAGPGGAGTESLGEYLQPGASTPYVVQEVRSVLLPQDAS
jgi:PKD domain